MSEELSNKIRLNQARRQAVRSRAGRADQSSGRSRKSLYGEKEEAEAAKNKAGASKEKKSPVKVAKKVKDVVTAPLRAEPMDIAIYGAAFVLAAFKDLIDLALGIFPGVITAIGFCVSIAIGFLLLFDGVSGTQRRIARRMTKKFLVLIAGTIVESFLVGLNFLPFEIFTVLIIYWMSLAERKSEVNKN